MDWLASRTTTPARLAVLLVAAFAVLLGLATLGGHVLKLAEGPRGATSLDSSITTWAVTHRTGGLTTVARALSTIGSQRVLLPLTIVVAVLLIARRRFVPAGLLLVTWGGALGLYNLTKDFVGRPRPPMAIWLTQASSSSFPSGHATQSLATFFALALASAVWLPRARAPAVAVAVLLGLAIGWSRVYLGVHWATDVGAGWLVAAAWLAIVAWAAAVAKPIERRLRAADDGARRSTGR